MADIDVMKKASIGSSSTISSAIQKIEEKQLFFLIVQNYKKVWIPPSYVNFAVLLDFIIRPVKSNTSFKI